MIITNRKIAIAGGGTENDSIPIDLHFSSWLDRSKSLLYIPVALRWSPAKYENTKVWLENTFKPCGICNIQMTIDISKVSNEKIFEYAGIYIGGGNTFYLLKEIRNSGFDYYLSRFVEEGGPVYGGSAGAVILGKNVLTVNDIDENDVGLDNTEGLNLAHEYSIWPHYTPQMSKKVEEYYQSKNEKLLVLTEKSGAVCEDGQWKSVGSIPAQVFDKRGWGTIPEA